MQLPDSQTAVRREISHKIREIKAANKGKPAAQRSTFKVSNQKLVLNDEVIEKPVLPPSFADLFADPAEQERMEKTKLWYADPVQEKGNVFVAIGIKTSNLPEIRRAYQRVRQLYPSATHVSVSFNTGCHDDGEYGKGLRIQKFIKNNGAVNRVAFVVRITSSSQTISNCRIPGLRSAVEGEMTLNILTVAGTLHLE